MLQHDDPDTAAYIDPETPDLAITSRSTASSGPCSERSTSASITYRDRQRESGTSPEAGAADDNGIHMGLDQGQT